MPSFALQFRGALTNVSGLVPAEGVDAALLIPMECTSCHEEHPNPVALEASNVAEMQKSRGVANLVMHCPGCRRENAATFVVSKSEKLGEVSPWSAIDTDGDWATLCTIEFRGMQPRTPTIHGLLTDSSSWTCRGTESGTPFTDVQFEEDGEWHDYDDKAGDEVSITEVELRWLKV